jgi:hypothetical protein
MARKPLHHPVRHKHLTEPKKSLQHKTSSELKKHPPYKPRPGPNKPSNHLVLAYHAFLLLLAFAVFIVVLASASIIIKNNPAPLSLLGVYVWVFWYLSLIFICVTSYLMHRNLKNNRKRLYETLVTGKEVSYGDCFPLMFLSYRKGRLADYLLQSDPLDDKKSSWYKNLLRASFLLFILFFALNLIIGT